jgi:anti-sigma regulatory factor (Ser/Thr protein kinase)
MKNSAVIIIPSHPKYLSVVRDVTLRMAEMCGIAETVREEIKLAVDEACSNVIKYAYKGEIDRKIVVKFKINRKRFEVIIEDNGIKADIESIKGRSLDDIRPGGLGIHFINKVFDTLSLDEKKKKGNRLKLIRYLKESR